MSLSGILVSITCLVNTTFLIAALYQQLGEKENEMENSEYLRKKEDDLRKRLADAHASIHHIELVRAFIFFFILCTLTVCHENWLLNH